MTHLSEKLRFYLKLCEIDNTVSSAKYIVYFAKANSLFQLGLICILSFTRTSDLCKTYNETNACYSKCEISQEVLRYFLKQNICNHLISPNSYVIRMHLKCAKHFNESKVGRIEPCLRRDPSLTCLTETKCVRITNK